MPQSGQASGAVEATDDYALMRAIGGGDAAALKGLYDRHGAAVYALAKRMLRDEGEAEQLLTDVFFEIWDARGRYDEERGSPITYLMRLTRSRAIDRLRRRGPAGMGAVALDPGAGIDVATEAPPDAAAEVDERRRLVRGALESLDGEQRRVIECAYYEGMSQSEIAARLNKPLGTVKSSMRIGLARLRDALARRLEK